jgi:RNA-directed DNA polymerase
LLAWEEFVKGKRGKKDIQEFALNLMDKIILLHQDLKSFSYRHGGYYAFKISDSKPRDIHKASVRDRLVHHSVHRILYPFFDRTFIDGSFSCRNKKGTHKAIKKLRQYFYKVSLNDTCTCFCLKMDIKKFFANIDHEVLFNILQEHIEDSDLLWLLENIIKSFSSKGNSIGLPLGNLTSQLFVNIYMNEFDQFVKHKLKEKYYIRYADDFIVLSEDYEHLIEITSQIKTFLKEHLKLKVHENKVFIKTISSGLDFLGIINFTDHRTLRTKTKKRIIKRINEINSPSYLGLLKHCNSYKIRCKIKLWQTKIN